MKTDPNVELLMNPMKDQPLRVSLSMFIDPHLSISQRTDECQDTIPERNDRQAMY